LSEDFGPKDAAETVRRGRLCRMMYEQEADRYERFAAFRRCAPDVRTLRRGPDGRFLADGDWDSELPDHFRYGDDSPDIEFDFWDEDEVVVFPSDVERWARKVRGKGGLQGRLARRG
jgi:hypothetical protein